jgi:hypothetical protein
MLRTERGSSLRVLEQYCVEPHMQLHALRASPESYVVFEGAQELYSIDRTHSSYCLSVGPAMCRNMRITSCWRFEQQGRAVCVHCTIVKLLL